MVTDGGILSVRWQDRPSDLPQLVDLFRGAYPDEAWTEADFVGFKSKEDANNVLKVLVGADGEENAGRLYGALLYTVGTSSHPSAPGEGCDYKGEPPAVRVRRLAVHPDFRRHGLGTFLMSFLVGRRSPVRRRRYRMTVSEYALGAHLFLKALGFRVAPGGIVRRTGRPSLYVFEKLVDRTLAPDRLQHAGAAA